MHQHLVYAKKFRLPSQAANVLQAMNMAVAFGMAGARVRCFPGCSAEETAGPPDGQPGGGGNEARKRVLLESMRRIGMREAPDGWTILPGDSKGEYGLRFRLSLLTAAMGRGDRLFYVRDLPELSFLSAMTRFLPRTLVYEAHEVLHLMHKAEGSGRWRETLRREKKALQSVAGLVALNPQVLEEARDHLGYAGPALLAPNGYNPALFHALPLFTEQTPWPGSADAVRLVYVGNFHPGKGVETLIRAMTLLPSRFHLRVIGGSPEDILTSLRAETEALGLGGRVEFTGALPPQELWTACAGSHIFVIPQQSEFYLSPLKLNEAMALGLPVLATPLSVFRRGIEAGQVSGAPGAGPEGLARGIAGLAGNPVLANALRERGLAEAAGHTWRRRAENVLDFIKNLQAGRPRAAQAAR